MKKILIKALALTLALSMMSAMLLGCSSKKDDTLIRVGGLKGATSIGLLSLKEDAKAGKTTQNYSFTMATAADEIIAAVAKGDMDIALIPANVSSVLYNKTKGNISVIDINTLGLLYMVSGDKSIESPADLVGRTVILTGKGTTPDFVLQYILKENGILDKVDFEYKSEATEVAAVLKDNPEAVGLLPQPFVTVACSQNDKLSVVMDMNKEWEAIQGPDGSRLVTGVTIVRNDFLKEHEGAVKAFLSDHQASVQAVDTDIERVAALSVEEGIIPKEPVAVKAIPNCNIVCLTGSEMKVALSGYLEVLFGLDNTSVGGSLPGDEFYYVK